jgi:hypothetical protein
LHGKRSRPSVDDPRSRPESASYESVALPQTVVSSVLRRTLEDVAMRCDAMRCDAMPSTMRRRHAAEWMASLCDAIRRAPTVKRVRDDDDARKGTRWETPTTSKSLRSLPRPRRRRKSTRVTVRRISTFPLPNALVTWRTTSSRTPGFFCGSTDDESELNKRDWDSV